jgi:Zn-dependent alcohol dehydrogenase
MRSYAVVPPAAAADLSHMSPLRKLAIIVGILFTAAASVALGAFAGVGVWLVTVVGCGLLGIAAMLTADSSFEASSR